VGELVGEHGADRGGAVFEGEFGEQSIVAVVVHHEVADAAVERDVLLHVVVGGARGTATGDVVGSTGVGRIDVALERHERFPVDRWVGLAPPQLQIGDHCQEEVVVRPRRLVGPEIDGCSVELDARWNGGGCGWFVRFDQIVGWLGRVRHRERGVVDLCHADRIGAFGGHLDAAGARAHDHGAGRGQGNQRRAMHEIDVRCRAERSDGGCQDFIGFLRARHRL